MLGTALPALQINVYYASSPSILQKLPKYLSLTTFTTKKISRQFHMTSTCQLFSETET